MLLEVLIRRMRSREEAIHPPRGIIREECYLGRGVDVLNIYERCSHGCSYCYVEWPWSPRSIVVRINLVEKVRREIIKRYLGKRVIVNLGSATDPYQPIEEKYLMTRRIIALLAKFNASIYICTKSKLILRDLNIIANYPHCWIGISISSLNDDFGKVFEPHATRPIERLRVIERLVDEGVQVVARISPIIPGVNDSIDSLSKLIAELESIGVKYVVAELLKLDRRGYIFYGWEGMPKWKRNLKSSLIEWGGEKLANEIEEMYYRRGGVLYGYVVPRENMRYKLLSRVRNLCHENIRFTTCNMGLAIKRRLSNWINREGKFMCACYAREPTPIIYGGK